MSKQSCCVTNCKNTGRNSTCKFYRFPTASYKLEQRKQWIAAVIRVNADSSPWEPKPSSRICSAHFINNEKSENSLSPSYVPTIFSGTHVTQKNVAAANNRFKLFMKKYMRTYSSSRNKARKPVSIDRGSMDQFEVETVSMDCESEQILEDTCDLEMSQEKLQCDREVQVFIEDKKEKKIKCGESFTCVQFMYTDTCDKCDVSTQTDIYVNTEVIKCVNNKIFKNKMCATDPVLFVDAGVQCKLLVKEEKGRYFEGLSSIKSDEQLLDVAGVHFETFNFLLEIIKKMKTDKFKVPVEQRLLIFLVKMKSGLTFSSLGIFFSIHRTTVSKIFFSILIYLESATKSLVYWPSKDVVQATMPDCFKPKYKNTRVIIDCTELNVDTPQAVDNKVFCYSSYKKAFTAKVLIGITPSGFISFKSKVAGGRKSDSQITIESGLLDLLEDDDIVMSDKGFPEFRTKVNNSGKRSVVVMPPFLRGKREFSKEETEETYSVASVRIHVERIMQRLRTYGILDKLHSNLFPYIDAIVHVCCCLVNLQPPIIAEKNTNGMEEEI